MKHFTYIIFKIHIKKHLSLCRCRSAIFSCSFVRTGQSPSSEETEMTPVRASVLPLLSKTMLGQWDQRPWSSQLGVVRGRSLTSLGFHVLRHQTETPFAEWALGSTNGAICSQRLFSSLGLSGTLTSLCFAFPQLFLLS